MKVGNAVIAQSDEMGALPTLFAATQPGLEGGTYVGPDGPGEQRGYPKVVKPNRARSGRGRGAPALGGERELSGSRLRR